MIAPFSRAAAESWDDIHWAVNAGLIEPPPLVWDCPNNPFVIEVNKPAAASGDRSRATEERNLPWPTNR